MAVRYEIMTTLWDDETRCGEPELVHSGESDKPHELWFDNWVKEYLHQQGKQYSWKNDRSFSLFYKRETGRIGEPYWVTSLWASEMQRDE